MNNNNNNPPKWPKMADFGKISPKKSRTIAAMLLASSIGEAAEIANVGERSIHRWLKDDAAFQNALHQAESSAVAGVARLMAGHAVRAVETLLAIIDDDEASNSERIAAARAFLSAWPTVRLLGSIEQRLTDLEGGERE